jgi:hypothetical protein
MSRLNPKTLKQLSNDAWKEKRMFEQIRRDCFAYANPQQNQYSDGDGTGRDGTTAGQKKTAPVYDSTLIHTSQKLANRIVADLFPPEQEFAELSPGSQIDPESAAKVGLELENLQSVMFEEINASNAAFALSEFARELVVAGEGYVATDEGDDAQPLIVEAVPESQVATRSGPGGRVEQYYRKHAMPLEMVKKTWPDAVLPEQFERELVNDPAGKVQLEDVRYWSREDGLWFYDVWINEVDASKVTPHRIVEREYRTARIAGARWSKNAGENGGRSPVMTALPDAKTLNRIKQLLLRSAALNAYGVWMAKASGVINVNNVKIFPGAIIPVQATGGQAGASIEPLRMTGDVGLSQFVMEDLVNSINLIMMNTGLPTDMRPGVTATEIVKRLQELQQDLGGPFGRIVREFVVPFLENVIDVLQTRGILPQSEVGTLRLDGKMIKVKVKSPLANAQALRDIEAFATWVDLIKAATPEAVPLLAKIESVGMWAADKLNVPLVVVRGKDELEKMQQGVAQLIGQQQNANGAVPQGVVPAPAQGGAVPVQQAA